MVLSHDYGNCANMQLINGTFWVSVQCCLVHGLRMDDDA